MLTFNHPSYFSPPLAEHLRRAEILLKSTKESLAFQQRARFCSETVIMHSNLLQAVSVYYGSLCKFLMRLAECDP